MSKTHQYLTFYINLTDHAVVDTLSKTGSPDSIGAVLAGPDRIAVQYAAPLLGKRATFVAPSITSEWINGPTSDPSNPFPTNVDTFERKSGGWFGVPFLFGDTIVYHWRGIWTYVPPVVPPGGAPPNLMTRRWIDGFEVTDPAAGGINPESGGVGFPANDNDNRNNSRMASRHVDGMGMAFRGQSAFRQHDTRENGAAAAPNAASWERIYLRLRAAPATQCRLLTWLATVDVSGFAIEIMPSGQLVYGWLDTVSTFTIIGTTAALPVDVWKRLDVVVWFGTVGVGGTQFSLWINGVSVVEATMTLTGPGAVGKAHGPSRLGVNGVNTLAIDCDDWINAAFGGVLTGVDFQNGSRVLPLWATSQDASSHDWTGDWRHTLTNPISDADVSLLSSAVNGALLAVAVNAGDADSLPESLGAVAVHVHGATTGVFANTAGMVGGVATTSRAGSIVAGDWKTAFASLAATPTPLKPLAPLVITYRKDAAGATLIKHLSATVELIGSFGPEDIGPAGLPTVPLPANTGPHNSPYPRTPWARLTVAPVQPVFVRGGTYVGTGTFLDLTFPSPIHFFHTRPITGNAGGARWFSSMVAAHVATNDAAKANAMVQALMDGAYVPGTAETDAQMVDRRIWEAKMQTRGEPPTQVDYVYWRGVVAADPLAIVAHVLIDYWWQKMLGNGALGVDIPPNGPYAVPPSALLPLAAGISSIGDANSQQQAILRLVGANAQSNALGVTYQYVAVGDPGQRFMCNAGLAHLRGTVDAADHTTPLIHPTFTPEAGFFHGEAILGVSNSLYYKGPGHAAATIQPINSAELANALTWAQAAVTCKFALSSTASMDRNPMPFSLWRTNDGSSDAVGSNKGKVVQITSYVGDGNASRTLLLTPAVGKRPLYAMVVPHGTGAAYVRDAGDTTTSSWLAVNAVGIATAIVGGGIDSLLVGITLNANGVVYDVFAIPGSDVAGNAGFSVNGDFWPVPPEPPPNALSDPGGPEPGDAPPDVIVPIGTDPLAPIGPIPGLTDDLTACPVQTLGLVNLALSRIGSSQQIGNLATDATTEAIVARLVYGEAVQQTLRDFPWPFATRYAKLALVTAGPNSDWAFAYRQPSDCVFERRLVAGRGTALDPTPPPFQLSNDFTAPGVGGGLLFCNVADAVLEYTARIICPAQFGDPLFRDALTFRLMLALAPSLTRMTDLTVDAAKLYAVTLDLARQVLRPGNPGAAAAAPLVDLSPQAQQANVIVVNRALIRIGARTIASLLTEQSAEAQGAQLVFEEELQATLRDYPWPFATAYVTPTLVAGTATVSMNLDWQYSYRLPADVLFARRILSLAGAHRAYDPNPTTFRVGQDAVGKLLYTNAVDPQLEYTTRPEAAVLIADALFRDALSWRLASTLAPSLAQLDPLAVEQLGRGPEDPREPKAPGAQTAQLRGRVAAYAWSRYEHALAKAQVPAAAETQQDPPGEADWIAGR